MTNKSLEYGIHDGFIVQSFVINHNSEVNNNDRRNVFSLKVACDRGFERIHHVIGGVKIPEIS